MRSIIAFSLMFILGLFSFGITFHEHLCAMDGKEISFFIQIDHTCSTDTPKSASCCQTKLVINKKDCCSDKTKIVQWMPKAFSTAHQHVFTPLTLIPSPQVTFVVAGRLKQHEVAFPAYRGPPKPRGKELLILNQVFRI